MQEAWWLRRASYRARCRLIAECADAFDIKVNHIRDIHAYDASGSVRVAVQTIDTVTHDMCVTSSVSTNDTVHLFDGCVNVNNIRNGLLCSMHPSEGFWIFKGAQNRAQGANAYGMAWYSGKRQAVGIPTSVIKIHYNDVIARKARVTETGEKTGMTPI